MLFGRRKPGFSKEVELRPEDISDEFSDRNDPAMCRNSNPKEEKAAMAAMADAVMRGEAETGKSSPEEKVDVFEYMESLPEVEDTFPPSDDPMVVLPEEQDAAPIPAGRILAEYIRERSGSALLTARKALEEGRSPDDPEMESVISEMTAMPECADIRTIQGEQDVYFYSSEVMANNYAMIAMLIMEKDLKRIVADMVRFNCKTYPSPTPLYYFMKSPYFYGREELDQTLELLLKDEKTQDIKTVTAFNDVLYLYSENIMSRKYAQALANDGEAGEAEF